MKKAFTNLCMMFTMVLMIAACAACTGKSALEADIETSNKDLPEEIAEGITMEKFTYSGDVVTMNVTFSPDYTTQQIDMFAAIMQTQLQSGSGDADIEAMIDLIKDAKANFCIKCKGAGGYVKSITIPYTDF